jgi:serine/threonine protein kinase
MSPRTIPGQSHNHRVEEIFGEALEIAPEERDAFLDRACAGDDVLRHEVEDLLAVVYTRTAGFLPTGDLAIPVLAGETLAGLHPTLQGLSLAAGMRIDRYELLRSLGRGGMGTVFLAYDTRLHRRVAIKFLHAATLDMTERFLAEARATARCKHENIIIVHDVDTVDGHPYMVLEYLEGESLRQRLTRLAGETAPGAPDPTAAPGAPAAPGASLTAGPAMPVTEALAAVIPLVRALGRAHEHGIVHRDLKPENVFLCSDGVVKVLDFGIAKVLADAPGPDSPTVGPTPFVATTVAQEHFVTQQGVILGTLPYMSPEQWGADDIDERTDIWAVGIMLHEMLAGRHPLAPLSPGKIRKRVLDLDRPMPSIDDAVPGLGRLAEVIDGCLRKRKAERVHGTGALLRALEQIRADLSTSTTIAAPAAPPLLEELATRRSSGHDVPGSPDIPGVPAVPDIPGVPAVPDIPGVPGINDTVPISPPRRGWRQHVRKLLLAALAGWLVVLALLAFWPRITIPAFPGTSGGVALTVRAGADDALLATHRDLCAALRDIDAQAVRCLELPRFGVGKRALRRAAGEAGASLVAWLESDHDLRLLPVSTEIEILSELPTLHVEAAVTQQHLAGILYPLSRALAGDLRFDALRAPPVSPDTVGWRLATLSWYLNVLARNQQAIFLPDLRRTMTRCRHEASLADASCALAHYVYARLEPAPPDARYWLESLRDQGPRRFADPVTIELAADDCTRDPARAEATVLRLAARWARTPCRLVSLVGPAACLLARYPQASAALQPIAYPGDDILSSAAGASQAMAPQDGGATPPQRLSRGDTTVQCGTDLAAAALARRGQWNMQARRWSQATRDFDAAWKQGDHPLDLLHWAESLLHQRDSRADVAPLIAAALDLGYFHHDPALRHRAAFVRWLATHDRADAATLLHIHGDSPDNASVLGEDTRPLAALACADPTHVECRVYEMLAQPKQPGSTTELQILLRPGRPR